MKQNFLIFFRKIDKSFDNRFLLYFYSNTYLQYLANGNDNFHVFKAHEPWVHLIQFSHRLKLKNCEVFNF